MDFTPDVEYGFIREEVSHKLYMPLVNPLNTWDFGNFKRQYLTNKFVFQNWIFKLYLAIFMGISREWDKFIYIPHSTLTLPPYAQGRIQKYASQWILPQMLNMDLLGRKSHTNYTCL